MKERIKAYFTDVISTWRGRWAMRGWRERLSMLLAPIVTVISILVAIWLALWFFFGAPSVKIDDVTVDLDRSMSLAGVDKDANGIRDDIDNYIKVLAEKKAYSEPQVKALQQNARMMQGLVTVDFSDAKAVRSAAEFVNKSSWCLSLKFKDSMKAYRLGMHLERLTVNTKQRAIAYMKFNHAMDGTVWASPKSEDACEL